MLRTAKTFYFVYLFILFSIFIFVVRVYHTTESRKLKELNSYRNKSLIFFKGIGSKQFKML